MLLPARELGGVEVQTLQVVQGLRERFARIVVALPETAILDGLRTRLASLRVSTLGADIAWDDALDGAANHARQAAAAECLARAQPFALALVAIPWPRVGLGLLAGLARAGIPAMAVFHLASEQAWVPPRERAAALAGRPVLIAVSTALRDTLARRLDVAGKSILVIPNGVDTARGGMRWPGEGARRGLQAWPGLPADAPLVLTTARFASLKGYEDLVAVAEIVARRRPDARFLCLGEGPLRPKIVRMLEARGLHDTHVRCPGWVDDPTPYYAAADLFLLPTHGEGHSLALLEAAAHRLPLVTTAASGQDRLLADGSEALLAPPGDVPALARALLAVLDQPGRACRLGAAARAWAERHDLRPMQEAYVRVAEASIFWQVNGN